MQFVLNSVKVQLLVNESFVKVGAVTSDKNSRIIVRLYTVGIILFLQ